MKLSKRNSLVAGLASVAVLGLGGVAIAANSGSDDRATAFAEALSAQTGAEITAEDVTAARKQLAKDRVEQAVTDGRLTREEADAILERIESGEGLGRGFPIGGPGSGHHSLRGGGAHIGDVADALGLDADALRDALRDGQSLSEFAEGQGKTRAQVLDAIKEEITAEAEERGVDPPAGEDLTTLAERIADGTRGAGFGRGPGMGGLRGTGAAVADALGLDADALRDALRDGQSLSEFAESQGKTRAQVLDAIKKAITEKADDRGVEAPTGDELDALAERLADREGGKRGFGGPRGHHGHGPWGAPDGSGDDTENGSLEGAALGA